MTCNFTSGTVLPFFCHIQTYINSVIVSDREYWLGLKVDEGAGNQWQWVDGTSMDTT